MRKGIFIAKSAMFVFAILISILVLASVPEAKQTAIDLIAASR